MERNHSDGKNIFLIRDFLKDYLNFRKDKEEESLTVSTIRDGIEIKGATLLILVFAIFLASLGLNQDSTAVIIGAMLISPLMGPIMGVGLSVGLDDFDLMKQSLKSYLVTTLFSVATSTLYFLVSPVIEGQSELLARTSPSVYDVFIALLGGLAGFVALATTKKGLVIPGVAIATALMPPLCTAGYGLATGNLLFFLGAFYLYFINSVFICLATYIGTRMFRFKRLEFTDPVRKKKVKQYIILVVLLAMVPSVYLTVRILGNAFYENAANEFIQNELSFESTHVVDKEVYKKDGRMVIRIVLVGKQLPDSVIGIAKGKMPQYSLGNADLQVLQGINSSEVNGQISMQGRLIDQLSRVMADERVNSKQVKDSLSVVLDGYQKYETMAEELASEFRILYPEIQRFSLARSRLVSTTSSDVDSVLVFAGNQGKKKLTIARKEQLNEWLKARLGSDKVYLVME